MALSYVEIYKVAGSEANPQMPVAVVIAARGILSEDPGTDQHPARLVWAQKALADPFAMAKVMIWGLLVDSDVAAKWPNLDDGTVQKSVDALVNGYLNA